ncbi:MAG TPA: hypothetical protein VGG10_10015 [Rhizomicrobium sp.]|jgi:hypothetical protein
MSRRLVLPIVVAAVIGLVLLGVHDGASVARAWLCAFVLISMVPIGSLVLLLTHGITGGRWGEDLSPVLAPAARTIPLLLLAFVPIMLFRPLIYSWSTLPLPHDVRSFYLDPAFFDARSVAGIVVWSVLAWTAAWRRPLYAALGLTAHLVIVTVVPADWVLTIAPGSVSAGFGLGFGIEQLFAALAFTAVLAPQPAGRANRDLAGMMMTTLLATVYFFYMAFIITWYGNIPAKVHWYTVRAGGGWALELLVAFVLGAALPFLAVLNPKIRSDPSLLRIVGTLVLAGIALHVVWLIVPALGALVLVPATFAALVIALLLWLASRAVVFRGGATG